MKENIKKLYKPFILIFFISFLIINWSNISPVFNYRIISARVSDLFERDRVIDKENADEENTTEENTIEVPKIGIQAPIISVENGIKNSNDEDFEEVLKNGVLLYPDSVLPGEIGTTIILGHSAPVNWPKINYDDIFSRLNELEKGDKIVIYFNHLKYTYQVYDRHIFYPKDEQDFLSGDNEETARLVLLTCWPPGKDFQRFAVLAKII